MAQNVERRDVVEAKPEGFTISNYFLEGSQSDIACCVIRGHDEDIRSENGLVFMQATVPVHDNVSAWSHTPVHDNVSTECVSLYQGWSFHVRMTAPELSIPELSIRNCSYHIACRL